MQHVSSLKDRIKEKMQEKLVEITTELLNSFIICDPKLLPVYMKLLNMISNVAIQWTHPETLEITQSDPIKSYFLKNCKKLIYDYISENNIRLLSSKNLDDPDEEDFYHKEKNKIVNIIMTICSLYDQRNNTTDIKLMAPHINGILCDILNICIKLITTMKELGNPYEIDDCKDEIEYILSHRMCIFYSELILVFLDKEFSSFMNDKTPISKNTTLTLSDFVHKFKEIIFPILEEPYLIAKCKQIGLTSI